MQPTAHNGVGVKAQCPSCNAITVWDFKDTSREFGYVLQEFQHQFAGVVYGRVHWRLLRCAGCGRGGIGKFHDSGNPPALELFYPSALVAAPLPADVPQGVVNEYREAELCTSVRAWRAASALLRSALEKLLKANGFDSGTLQQRIDAAAQVGVITPTRKQKAHDDVRVLGNEIVHDDWRSVAIEEVTAAMHYVQRVAEDLYDDRASVVKLLVSAGRIPQP